MESRNVSQGADPGPHVRGRLHLWNLALFECEALLKLGARARRASERHLAVGGEVTDKMREPPFENWHDLDDAHYACAALAVVYFGQVFNRGDAYDGVAANSGVQISAEREGLIQRAFPTTVERAKFDAILKAVSEARDQVFAHADAEQFGVRHSNTMVTSRTHSSALLRLDLEGFQEVAGELSRTALARMRELGLSIGWVR